MKSPLHKIASSTFCYGTRIFKNTKVLTILEKEVTALDKAQEAKGRIAIRPSNKKGYIQLVLL